MMPRRLWASLVPVAALAAPGWAFHAVFEFTVDRFTIDGNLHGALDGVPDAVDEFDGTSTTFDAADLGQNRGDRIRAER